MIRKRRQVQLPGWVTTRPAEEVQRTIEARQRLESLLRNFFGTDNVEMSAPPSGDSLDAEGRMWLEKAREREDDRRRSGEAVVRCVNELFPFLPPTVNMVITMNGSPTSTNVDWLTLFTFGRPVPIVFADKLVEQLKSDHCYTKVWNKLGWWDRFWFEVLHSTRAEIVAPLLRKLTKRLKRLPQTKEIDDLVRDLNLRCCGC